MGNRNQNPNAEPQNGEKGALKGGEQTEGKTSFIGKIIQFKNNLMKHKSVRMAVKGLKIAGVGGLAFASYKAGARSVKPTTVYIREGVTEEETPQETQETVDEETGEVTE